MKQKCHEDENMSVCIIYKDINFIRYYHKVQSVPVIQDKVCEP